MRELSRLTFQKSEKSKNEEKTCFTFSIVDDTFDDTDECVWIQFPRPECHHWCNRPEEQN